MARRDATGDPRNIRREGQPFTSGTFAGSGHDEDLETIQSVSSDAPKLLSRRFTRNPSRLPDSRISSESTSHIRCFELPFSLDPIGSFTVDQDTEARTTRSDHSRSRAGRVRVLRRGLAHHSRLACASPIPARVSLGAEHEALPSAAPQRGKIAARVSAGWNGRAGWSRTRSTHATRTLRSG